MEETRTIEVTKDEMEERLLEHALCNTSILGGIPNHITGCFANKSRKMAWRFIQRLDRLTDLPQTLSPARADQIARELLEGEREPQMEENLSVESYQLSYLAEVADLKPYWNSMGPAIDQSQAEIYARVLCNRGKRKGTGKEGHRRQARDSLANGYRMTIEDGDLVDVEPVWVGEVTGGVRDGALTGEKLPPDSEDLVRNQEVDPEQVRKLNEPPANDGSLVGGMAHNREWCREALRTLDLTTLAESEDVQSDLIIAAARLMNDEDDVNATTLYRTMRIEDDLVTLSLDQVLTYAGSQPDREHFEQYLRDWEGHVRYLDQRMAESKLHRGEERLKDALTERNMQALNEFRDKAREVKRLMGEKAVQEALGSIDGDQGWTEAAPIHIVESLEPDEVFPPEKSEDQSADSDT